LREASLSRFEQFRQLIIPGANIDDQDNQGFTALKWAAHYGQVKMVLLLIEAGANVDSLDYHGSTALMEAVWKKHTEIVKLLLKYGANVNVMNRKSSTALSLALLGERDEIVNMLVKAGATGVTRAIGVVKVDTAEPSTKVAIQGSKEQGLFESLRGKAKNGIRIIEQ
jgi:ankyrin repeat protein